MIEQVGIGRFQQAELLNFMIDEVKDARTIGASELTPTPNELDRVLKIFKAGPAQIIASEHSAKVAAFDAVRDEAFCNLTGCIRGETFRPEAAGRSCPTTRNSIACIQKTRQKELPQRDRADVQTRRRTPKR